MIESANNYCGVVVIVDPGSNPGKAAFISHSANTDGNDMNRTTLPPDTSKQLEKLDYLILVGQMGKRKNSEFKAIKLRFKIIIVSHPVRAGGG